MTQMEVELRTMSLSELRANLQDAVELVIEANKVVGIIQQVITLKAEEEKRGQYSIPSGFKCQRW